MTPTRGPEEVKLNPYNKPSGCPLNRNYNFESAKVFYGPFMFCYETCKMVIECEEWTRPFKENLREGLKE